MEMNDALTTKCTFLKTNGFALYNKISEACTLDSSNTGNRCFNLVFHSTNRGSKVTYSTTAMCHLRREAWPLHEHVCVCVTHIIPWLPQLESHSRHSSFPSCLVCISS